MKNPTSEQVTRLANRIAAKHCLSGGASTNILNGHEPTDGYMVAIPGGLVCDGPYLNVADVTVFIEFISDRGMRVQPSDYIGTWFDAETNTSCLEFSNNVLDRAYALHLARMRKQLAIWDVVASMEIRVTPVPDPVKYPSHWDDLGACSERADHEYLNAYPEIADKLNQ